MLLLLHMLLGMLEMLWGIWNHACFCCLCCICYCQLVLFVCLLNYRSCVFVYEVYVLCWVPGDHGSWQTCHEQVNGYNNFCFRGFETREEAEDDYSKLVLREKSNHEAGKGAGLVRLSGPKNLIIFVQFIVIVVMFVFPC